MICNLIMNAFIRIQFWRIVSLFKCPVFPVAWYCSFLTAIEVTTWHVLLVAVFIFCFTFRVLSILILEKVGLLFLERHADWATFHLILTETHWNIITCMPTRRPSVPNIGSSKWKSVLLAGEIHTVQSLSGLNESWVGKATLSVTPGASHIPFRLWAMDSSDSPHS